MSDNDDLDLESMEGGGDAAPPPPAPEGDGGAGFSPATLDDNPPSAAPDDGAHGGDEMSGTAHDLEAIYDIPVQVSAVLGRTTMQVSQLLKLGRGAVVELDRKVGEAIDIYVNNCLVARGEVVVVEDRLGVTMTEIIKGERLS